MGIFDFLKSGSGEAKPVAPDKLAIQADEQNLGEPQTTPPPSAAEKRPAGMFDRFRSALKRTSDLLNTDIRDLFKREGRLVDDEFLDELFAILIKTDIGVGPANEIRDEIKTNFRGRVVQMTDVLDVIKAKVRVLLKQDETPVKWAKCGAMRLDSQRTLANPSEGLDRAYHVPYG